MKLDPKDYHSIHFQDKFERLSDLLFSPVGTRNNEVAVGEFGKILKKSCNSHTPR